MRWVSAAAKQLQSSVPIFNRRGRESCLPKFRLSIGNCQDYTLTMGGGDSQGWRRIGEEARREDPLNPYAAIDSTVPRIARSRERRHHGQTTGRQVAWPPHAATRIQFTFKFEGARYRPTLPIAPSEANLRRVRQQLARIKQNIATGTFSFETFVGSGTSASRSGRHCPAVATRSLEPEYLQKRHRFLFDERRYLSVACFDGAQLAVVGVNMHRRAYDEETTEKCQHRADA